MGINVLTERADGVPMPAKWFNDLRQALLTDLVPRNSNGIPTDESGSIGTEEFQWLNGRFKNLFLGGQAIETNQLAGRNWRVSDGTKKASGFPNYLVPAGSGNGLSATIDTTSQFQALSNGVQIILESNLVFSSLSSAPSTNNTANIDDISLASQVYTKYLGELDSKPLIIDAIGSEISDRNGEIAAFKTLSGEIILARIDTSNNQILPIVRGYAGTQRGALTNNNAITLLQINTLLLKNDSFTSVSSTIYPDSVVVLPVAGSAGKSYIKISDQSQHYDDGLTVDANFIIVGYAICDNTDCLYVENSDFDVSWNDSIALSFRVIDSANIQIQNDSRVGVKSNSVQFSDYKDFNTTTNLESGQSLTANTELFLYLDDLGNIIFSHKKPRRYKSLLRGLYHPNDYYRSVGSVMLDGSANILFKRSETPSRESIYDMLPPIGTIIDMVGSYFSNGSNGSPTRVIGNSPNDLNTRLPSGWRVCDGSELFDPESDIYRLTGRFLPNLTDSRFTRGSNSIAGLGGSSSVILSINNMPTHSHTINHSHTLTDVSGSGHIHSSGSISANLNMINLGQITAKIQSSSNWNPTNVTTGLSVSSGGTTQSNGLDTSGNTGSDSSGSTPSISSHGGNSGNKGSGTSFNIVPVYFNTIKIIKVK